VIGDDVIVYKASAGQWWCLGGCWCRGEQVGEEKEARGGRSRRGEEMSWRVQGVLVHALACPGRRGRVWARRSLASVDVSSTQGSYQHMCGSEGELLDMMIRIKGEGT
jgi:hypothetical protein